MADPSKLSDEELDLAIASQVSQLSDEELDAAIAAAQEPSGMDWGEALKDAAASTAAHMIAPGTGQALGPALRESVSQMQESPVGELLPSYGDVGAELGISAASAAIPAVGAARIAQKVGRVLPSGLRTMGKVLGTGFGAVLGRDVGEELGNVPESEQYGLGVGLLDAGLHYAFGRFGTRTKELSEDLLLEAGKLRRKMISPTSKQIKSGMEILPEEVRLRLDDAMVLLQKEGAFPDGVRSVEGLLLGAKNAQRRAEAKLAELSGNRIPKTVFWANVRNIVDDMAQFAVGREGEHELAQALLDAELLQREVYGLFKTSSNKGVALNRWLNLKRAWATRTKFDPTITGKQKFDTEFWRKATGKASEISNAMFDEAFPENAGELKRANAIWGAAADVLPAAINAEANFLKGGSREITRLAAQGGALSGTGALAMSALPASAGMPWSAGLLMGLPSFGAAAIAGARTPLARGLRSGLLTTAGEVIGLLPRSAERVFDNQAEFIGALTRAGVDAKLIQQAHQLLGSGNLDAMDDFLSRLYATNPALAQEAEESELPGFNVVGGKVRDPIEQLALSNQYRQEMGYDPNLETRSMTLELAARRRALNRDGTVTGILIESKPVLVSTPQPITLNTIPLSPTSSMADNIRATEGERVEKPY